VFFRKTTLEFKLVSKILTAEWMEVSASCNGTSQSPVNIVTRKVTVDRTLTPLGFQGYQEAFHSVITNNGHTGDPSCHWGDLKATYKAVELHFHWGKDGGPGSEHTIDGEQYPMEMHIVHIKEIYIKKQINSSKNVENSLADFSILGNSSEVGPLSLDLLIPSQNELKKYFRYKGSLTTPNCSESVVWTVFQKTILLSKSQVSYGGRQPAYTVFYSKPSKAWMTTYLLLRLIKIK
uniref:Carbonic anhydrase n=1 Tax=Pygocentrus nattereri TaxID=42514 RepID=A0A3B4DNP9_PYGNA